MTHESTAGLGAHPTVDGTRFACWTTHARKAAVRFFEDGRTPGKTIELTAAGSGRFEGDLRGVGPGALYKFVLDGSELPDPYARFLPFGVHGPAEVIARAPAPPLAHSVPLHRTSIYELHVGTFTPEGTYAAAARRLSAIAELGVTTLELLPLSSFPGERGWGYDGVAHFAPFAGYGRPEDLRAFLKQAHDLDLSVLLDVVLNHFGPAGNYLGAYAPEYFTKEHETPWGPAPDFAAAPMRRYALELAAYWLEDFGFDGLRLDATHAIFDPSPLHILRELHLLAGALVPPRRLIAEDERNDPTLVQQLGLDAVWADDFHHQLRVLLTGERDGYYAAYAPTVDALAQVISRGWTYEGQVYPPWGRPRGAPCEHLLPEQLVYCIQNHDQIGNRALGTRLNHDVALEPFCAAQALLLFLPMTPLLFMGQEWAASTPFLFFSHHEAELGARVSKGRRSEFAGFKAFSDPDAQAQIPDPQAPETFERSQLRWAERSKAPHDRVLDLTKTLLALRRSDPVLREPAKRTELSAEARDGVLSVERRAGPQRRTLIVNFSREPRPAPQLLRARLWESQPAAAGLPPWGAVILG